MGTTNMHALSIMDKFSATKSMAAVYRRPSFDFRLVDKECQTSDELLVRYLTKQTRFTASEKNSNDKIQRLRDEQTALKELIVELQVHIENLKQKNEDTEAQVDAFILKVLEEVPTALSKQKPSEEGNKSNKKNDKKEAKNKKAEQKEKKKIK